MATNDAVQSAHGTLTSTDEDIQKLTQFWDCIEIENRDTSTNPLYVSFTGTAVAAAEGTQVIQPGRSKLFKTAIARVNGIPGNTTTPCHQISLIGNGQGYSVMGVAGRHS